MSGLEIGLFAVLFILVGAVIIYAIATRNGGGAGDPRAILNVAGLTPEVPDADGASEVFGLVVMPIRGGGIAVRRYRPRRAALPADIIRVVQVAGQAAPQDEAPQGVPAPEQ